MFNVNKNKKPGSNSIKKKVSFIREGNSSVTSPKPGSTASPNVTSTQEFNDYAVERAESALGVLKADGHDLAHPNVNTFIAFIKKLDAHVATLAPGRDDLLEDIQARHLIKSIYSYGSLADTAIKLHTQQSNISTPAILPKIFAKCVEWLDVDKLLVDKSVMWWSVQMANITLKWSDADEQFCKVTVFEAEAFVNWIRQTISSQNLQRLFGSNKDITLLLELYLGIGFNLARVSECRPKLAEFNFIEPVSFFLTCNDQVCQCLALMLMTAIVNDSDSERLSDEFGIIPILTQFLDIASSSSDHRCAGFSAEELAHGASLVMVNDSNKAKFVTAGILSILDRMLKSDHEDEQSRVIDCLWTLAFGENERRSILKMKSTIDMLRKLASKKPFKVKAANALEFITNGKSNLSNLTATQSTGPAKPSRRKPQGGKEEKEKSVPPAASEVESGHIFISYSWKQQETCKRIRDLLKENGFRIWMDIDAMGGSTLEAMATAIEKAKIVVICYSDDYKQSPNCRTEAEYMFQLQKPFVPVNMQRRYRPDGWLGLILGARFYVDMSLVKTPFDEAAQKLLAELTTGLGQNSEQNPQPVEVSTHSAAKIVQPISAPPTKKPESTTTTTLQQIQHLVVPAGEGKKLLSVAFVKSKVDVWTVDDVKKWLDNQFLAQNQKLAALLKNMNGRHLGVIYEMKTLSAEIFYASLLKSLDGSLVDVLKFSEALERLPLLWAKSS